MSRSPVIVLVVLALALGAASGALGQGGGSDPPAVQHAQLVGRAQLDALTFRADTESSGAGADDKNGVDFPVDDQPLQGFSGLIRNPDGTSWP
jgi:glycerophosphoryl diester phosphodiesterase